MTHEYVAVGPRGQLIGVPEGARVRRNGMSEAQAEEIPAASIEQLQQWLEGRYRRSPGEYVICELRPLLRREVEEPVLGPWIEVEDRR